MKRPMFVLSAILLAGSAIAAQPALTLDAAKAKYERDRATCLSGQSQQDRETCLREAGAALEEAQRGRLGNGDAQFKRNAQQRCEGLPDAERKDCLTRVEGQGSADGSVRGGGVIKETVTRTVTPASGASAPKQ